MSRLLNIQKYAYNQAVKTVAQNRRARFDYEIIDTIEAGIMLTGQEVKSCREGNMNLSGAYVSLHTGKPVLKSATIAKYRFASGLEGYEPGRDRMLLLKKAQLDKLITELEQKGVSLVPLEVKAGRHIKIVLGLGRGKKSYDKRQSTKKKDIERRLREGREV